MNETWKDIKGFEGRYLISNEGRVRSLISNIILKNCLNDMGYYRVSLHKNKKQHTKKIHQLVAIAFLDHTPNGFKGLIVDHIDNNPLNNNVYNLQLITNRENSTKNKSGGTSEYIGVSHIESSGKWKAIIQINGKNKYLGNYDCELEAAKAYQHELHKQLTIFDNGA